MVWDMDWVWDIMTYVWFEGKNGKKGRRGKEWEKDAS